MANLLVPNNKIRVKQNSAKMRPAKITITNDEDPAHIEERMKGLPHWKYECSFTNYINDVKMVSEDQKKELLTLFKKQNYK